MDTTTERPKGRSMKELRSIIAAEDGRRDQLMDAWAEMTEDEQGRVVAFAEEIAAMREP